jgi:hypothetical protein
LTRIQIREVEQVRERRWEHSPPVNPLFVHAESLAFGPTHRAISRSVSQIVRFWGLALAYVAYVDRQSDAQ